MSNKTYIGLHPNNLNRTEYGQVVLYVEGEPVAFFSGSGDVVISGSLAIEGITNVSASIAAAAGSDTGSFMLTGSVNNDTITFTKGDDSTFDITITSVTSSISASYVATASLAARSITASVADNVFVKDATGLNIGGYLAFSTASGYTGLNIDGDLYYSATTNTLRTSFFSGSLLGTASYASTTATASNALSMSFDGNRPVTQPLLPDLVNYNPGTSTVIDFLEQVFYPDPGFGIEILTNEPFYILESELSGSHVRGATTTNTPVGNYYNVFASASFTANTSVTWSLQTNSVLDIEPLTGKLFIKLDLSGSATYQAPKTISGTVTANATSGGYRTRDFTVTVLDNTGPTISTSDISNYSPKAASFVTASGAYIGEVYINEQADPAGPPTIHTFGGSNPSFFSSSLYNQLAGVSYYKIYTTQALNSGSYVLNFTGSDLYGNEASASTTLVVNANTAPELTVFLPFSGQIQNYSSGSTYGSITVTDNVGDAIDTFTLSGPDASYFAVNRLLTSMGGLSARGQGSGTGTERWAVNFNTTPPFTGTYNITASATDNFAFTGSLAIPNSLSAATPSLPSPNGTFYVIESALTGASVTTATSGIAGTAATMTTNQPVSWSLSDDLSGMLAISGSAVGYITLQDNLSGSAYQNGSVLSGVVRATNVYGLYRENNINVTVTDNVGASISPNLSFLNSYYTKDGAAGFGSILVFDPQSIENVALIGVGGPDGDKFAFVSQSAGQSVLYPFSSSQALNSGSYIVGVTASDSYGQFTSQSFTVSVFANNPPVISLKDINFNGVTNYQPDINDATSGSNLGMLVATDGDNGIDGIASFILTGTDASKFNAVLNGPLTGGYSYYLQTTQDLTSGTYNLTGSATDGFGFVTNTPIPVTATVQAPSIPDPNGSFYVIESAVSSSAITTATSGIPGTQAQFSTNQSVTWTLNDGTYLAIDQDGKLSLRAHVSGSAKQAGSVIASEVVATNAFGASRSLTFTVAVTNDEDPIITNSLADKNNNKTTTATGFGTITISDPQALGNVSLTGFNGPNIGDFVFTPGSVGSTRVYTVSSSAALNSGSYSFSVTGSDAYNQQAKAAFTINVIENLAPTVTLTGFSRDVAEATNGTVIGSASIADPQDDSIASFTLSGTDASKFSASLASSTATTALYRVSATQDLASGSYNLTGSATDSFGLTTVTPIPVTISLAAPDVPIKNAVNFYIIESALSGSLVRVDATGYTGVQADMNTNQSVTWSIKSPSTYLAIDSDGGLSVKTNISGSAKNASGAPYNLIQEYVVATNSYGASSEVLVPVQVTANAAPVLSYTGLTVTSGSASATGETVGTVTATDPQSLDSITSIAITGGTDAAKFALALSGSTSYTKTYNINAAQDLGAGSYTIELTATDSFNKTTTESKTVTVESTGTTPVYVYINTINRSNLDNTETQALAAIGAQFYESYNYANPGYPLEQWISGSIGSTITVSGQGTATPKASGSVADLLEIKTLGTVTQDAAGSQPLFLFPSSSGLPSLPNTMYLGSDFSTMPAGQHALITYATTPPSVTTAGVLYFTTIVPVDGVTRWGVVYGLTGATGTNEWTIAASGDTLP